MTESDKSKEILTIFIGDFVGEFNELTNEMALKFKPTNHAARAYTNRQTAILKKWSLIILGRKNQDNF